MGLAALAILLMPTDLIIYLLVFFDNLMRFCLTGISSWLLWFFSSQLTLIITFTWIFITWMKLIFGFCLSNHFYLHGCCQHAYQVGEFETNNTLRER
jgi:hypothetical protein